MATKTISETLFEKFCSENYIDLHSVPTQPKDQLKSPDYEIVVSKHLVVVEVKQLDPNPEDKQHIELLLKTGSTGVITDEPGRRVRRMINKAMRQLKIGAKGIHPTVLVIYNNIGLLGSYIEPYDIRNAMYGSEVVDIRSITDEATGEYRSVLQHRFTGNRKVSPEHNTTLSAVASLYETDQGIKLDIYHNDYAAHPFYPDWLRIENVRHFIVAGEISAGGLREWEQT